MSKMTKKHRDLRIKITSKIAGTYYALGEFNAARLTWEKTVFLIKSRPPIEVVGMEIEMGLRQ